jgi:predicted flap endonuclease-1-like 5' DNA nuclease
VARSVAGALLILVIVFLARGPLLIAGGGRLDGLYPASVRDSLHEESASPDSTAIRRPRSGRRRTAPEAFVRNPLAFLSRAPVDSLVLLKGIGPVLAERIAIARNGKGPFTSWDDVLTIQGIGPKKLLILKEQARAVE